MSGFNRSSSNFSEQNSMANSTGRMGGEQALGRATFQSSGQSNTPRGSSFGVSMNAGRAPFTFNSSNGRNLLNEHFNSSNSRNLLPERFNSSEHFKVPHARPFGMSLSRVDPKSSPMMVDDASSFGSSAGGRNDKTAISSTAYVVPSRFNSSLSGRDFSGSMNGSFVAQRDGFSSSFTKGNFGSSMSRRDSFAGKGQEPSERSAMSVANSFHSSKGSVTRRSGCESGNKFAMSSSGGGPVDLNSFASSLSSFGQIKPDYLGLEAAKKKFQNSCQ